MAFSFFLWILLLIPGSDATPRPMSIRFVKNPASRNAICNDGTPAAYYVNIPSSPTPKTSRFIVYLEGGGGCYDASSCSQRWKEMEYLMTSTKSPSTLEASGIFDVNCTQNPTFCNWSAVYIHYCTSDWWSGKHVSTTAIPYAFYGRAVVRAVLEDLLADVPEFGQSETVLFSGTSAGGVGTWTNSDFVGSFVKQHLPTAKYSVVSDVGWFLDGPGLINETCNENTCNYQTRLTTGASMWGLQPHEGCAKAYAPKNELWKCLVGRTVYNFVESTKMGLVYQFDLWQAGQDGVKHGNLWDMSLKEREWVFGRGKEVRESFVADKAEEHGMFAPGCYDHGILPIDSFFTVKTKDGTSCMQAVTEFVEGGKPFHVDECRDLLCNFHCHRY